VVTWWLPERWAFIDEVPRTSVGKYDKKLLRARHAEGRLNVVITRAVTGSARDGARHPGESSPVTGPPPPAPTS
jgi:hypothetical protein